MIGIKRKSSIYYPIKKYYKRRLMVGDILTNRTLYADFPDDFVSKTDLLDEGEIERTFCKCNTSSVLGNDLREYTDNGLEYGIYVGSLIFENAFYCYNLQTNELEVNKNEYKMSDKVQDVTEVTDCQAYRHIYIKDPKIRPLKVGDVVKEGTILYCNFPDDLAQKLIDFRGEEPTGIQIYICNDILKGTFSGGPSLRLQNTCNYETVYNGTINLSKFTLTDISAFEIETYNDYDFWSQYIMVDETTLGSVEEL